MTGVGRFEALAAQAISLDLGGFDCRVMGLDDLILSKRAMARPKDLRTADELDVVRSKTRR